MKGFDLLVSMTFFKDVSLKKRLAVAFAGVVVFSALVITLVFTLVLVSSMKKSAREKIRETSKVASTFIANSTRGLEVYANLVTSDVDFGSRLSYDAALGIQQKIEEFKAMSQADLVAFVPRPEEYLTIKDAVFVNTGQEVTIPFLRKSKEIQSRLTPFPGDEAHGWMVLGDRIYLFALECVSHFGRNMGVIFLGKLCQDSLAKEISAAAGTEVVIFDKNQVFGSSIEKEEERLTEYPKQKHYAGLREKEFLEEELVVAGTSYLTFFSEILGVDKQRVAVLALQESYAPILEARNQTVFRVLFVACLATLLSAIVGYFLARAIANPLIRMAKTMLTIMEENNMGIRIQGIFGAEIGVLTRSFNRLLDQLQEAHDKLAASERRMKDELTMASTVQEMLFPERVVSFGQLSLSSFIDTSTETGGDWFGYGQDQTGKNATVLIGDVTGHGMPAALITAIANGFFKGVQGAENGLRDVLKKHSPEVADVEALSQKISEVRTFPTNQMLSTLNDVILESTRGSLLMTFFASVFDNETKILRYANAGHNRPFICRKQKGRSKVSVLPSEPSGRLGETKNIKFDENEIQLESGDLIVWYTDGILECENANGDMYGKRNIMQTLKKMYDDPVDQIRAKLIEDAYEFFGEVPRKDDITLVVGKVL